MNLQNLKNNGFISLNLFLRIVGGQLMFKEY